ncbi:putative Heat shock protein DnaJ, cysteine-rich domain superfamily [Dioscorea sansibarensis]
MASVLALCSGIHRLPSKSSFPNPSSARRRSVNLRFLFPTPAALSGSSWEREEARWLREEQRWLREEQRWLREEARWNSEREVLLKEIAALTIRIQALEHQQQRPMVEPAPRAMLVDEMEVKELVLEEDVSVPQVKVKKKRALRRGSEGDDVREMQEALQRLGFYSGEEDMEYSSFSSGTERAVKTWQASLGTPEDGVMTTELLEMLFMGRKIGDPAQKEDLVSKAQRDNENGKNGAPVVSATEIAEVQQTVIKESGTAEIEVSQQRVFLIGENRWEEPSRLVGRDKHAARGKPVSKTKCLSCRGEGRLMCIECDGTGEPNIEPQFLEWIDEGTKCPYCEGLGYTACDVCGGKATVET